jgi:sialic acid synthase SpsE
MNFKEKYLKEGPASYFIAEIGINHNGHMDLAKRMIDASKEARADAVKFQKRNFKALLLSGVEVEEPTGYLSKMKMIFHLKIGLLELGLILIQGWNSKTNKCLNFGNILSPLVLILL